MTELTFSEHKRSGNPTFFSADGILGIHYEGGEFARYLSDNIPAIAGEQHTVVGRYRVSPGASAAPVVVFWKENEQWQLHSTVAAVPLNESKEDFSNFEVLFTVPVGVDKFRVELRAWTGSGTVEFTEVLLDEELPDTPTDPENPPKRILTGFIRGRMLTLQEVAGEGSELPEWPCYPIEGIIWGNDGYFTIKYPEETEEEI